MMKNKAHKTLMEVILSTRRTIAPAQQVIRDKKKIFKNDRVGRKAKHRKERD